MSRTDHTREVTMTDVAARCGVSYQTVSRVINEMPEVADATRTRVLRVIEQLGYRPNMTARHLVSRRSTVLSTHPSRTAISALV